MIKRFLYCMWLVAVDIWLTINNAFTKDNIVEVVKLVAPGFAVGVAAITPLFLVEYFIRDVKDLGERAFWLILLMIIIWTIEYLLFLFFKAANKKCKEMST